MRETIAVVDLETTGVDPAKDQVIEAAWATVDVETACVIDISSTLFHAESNPAQEINGIPSELVMEEKYLAKPGSVFIPGMRAFVAHNAHFDSQWDVFSPLNTPWICTFDDWKWPKCSSNSQLSTIALSHGVGLVSAHRAYTDVLTICEVLRRVHCHWMPLADQIAYAMSPRKMYVSRAPFEFKDVVKSFGFRWYPDMKLWRKRMLPEDVSALPFEVIEEKGEMDEGLGSGPKSSS